MSDPRPIDAAITHLKRVYVPGPGRASEDPEPDFAEEEPAENLPDDLLWPPPGLEHIHGLLPRVTTELIFAAVLLTGPLWIATLRDRPAEAGSWGTVAVAMATGILLFATYIRILVLFNRATSAVRAGYPRQLVWHVAADSWRNTPQLLRGEFSFERLGITERSAILNARAVASLFAFAAALWITVTFPLWLLFAVTGSLSGQALLLGTLLPATLLALISLLFRGRELRLFLGNRIQDEEDRHTAQQARGWRRLYERAGYEIAAVDTGGRYRLLGVAAVLSIFLVLIPLVLGAFTMVVPQLVRMHASAYPITVRTAALEPLRTYRLPYDSAISPLQAGDAYHAIIMRGAAGTAPPLRKPKPVAPDTAFALLARAPALDFAGSRWDLPESGSPPRGRSEPSAQRFHEAAVSYLEQSGSSEQASREIIGAGFLITDDALRIPDAQAAQTVIQLGANALADLYERTGRAADAEHIRGVLNAAASASRSALVMTRETRPSQLGLRLAILTPHMPRAVRWDLFDGMSTTARCGSLPALVFGPGEKHTRFESYARERLVRYPSEERYFNLLAAGSADGRGSCNLRWIRDAMRGYR